MTTDRKQDERREHDERVRRERGVQEKARDEMNALVRRVDALSDGEFDEVTVRVARRKHGAKEAGDPLMLQGSNRARRAEGDRRESLQRKHLEYFVLKGTIDQNQMKAACYLHDLMIASTGGMQAMDWTRERVDCGKRSNEPFGGGVLDAERDLRRAFIGAGLNYTQMEILLRIIGQQESLTCVAISFERKPEAKINGACSRETIGYIKRLFVEALDDVHKFVFTTNRDDERPARAMLRAWHAQGSVPTDRPDLRGVEVGEAKTA